MKGEGEASDKMEIGKLYLLFSFGNLAFILKHLDDGMGRS